jgi:hypothetical protein
MLHNISVGRAAASTRGAARLIAAVALAATSACAPATVAGQAPSASRSADVPAIGGMRAHLFQNKKGEWSEDILAPQYGGSWNSIAGPNAANATLVVVEVSGPPGGTFTGFFGPETKYRVRLVAREGSRRVLLDQTQTIPVLNDQGKASLAFLLHQSGCTPVRLTASVVGARASKPLQRSLNFACGE